MRKTRAMALLSVALTELVAQHETVSDYDRFRHKYRDDLAGFALDCIDWREEQPTKYQIRVFLELVKCKRMSVRAPHGAGKTAIAAISVLWFALTRDGISDWKVVSTASSWRQLTKYLWPEIHKWAHRIKWEVIGRKSFSTRDELFTLSLKLDTGEAFAAASSRPEYMEGAHADSLLYVFDESKAVPDETFDAAEGAFSTAGNDGANTEDIARTSGAPGHAKHAREAYALAISTPGPPIGRFYDIQSHKSGYSDWNSIHITLEDSIDAGRITKMWADARREQWGKDSAVYKNRVLGEFASSEEDTVIPYAWIELANERWYQWNEARLAVDPSEVLPIIADIIGLDVAREGADKTVFALRTDNIITELRKYSREDTMMTTGRAVGMMTANTTPTGTPKIVVDVIGLGGGVVDRLRELNAEVAAFNASAKSYRKDRSNELGFANKRAEAWWTFREMLDPSFGSTIALPPDDELMTELITPHWKVTSGGKILIESKDDIKKRLSGRSTDTADAVIQCFADVQSYADMMQSLDDFAESLAS